MSTPKPDIIYELISAGLGIVSLGLSGSAYDKGAWFHTLETEHGQENMELRCRRREIESEEFVEIGIEPKPCPDGWLVLFAVILVGLALAATVGILVVKLLKPEQGIPNLDFLVLAGACAAYLMSAILLFAFVRSMYQSAHGDCDNQQVPLNAGAGVQPLRRKGRRHGMEESLLETARGSSRTCANMRTYVFQDALLITGLFFMVASGAMCGFTAAIVRKQEAPLTDTPVSSEVLRPELPSIIRQQQRQQRPRSKPKYYYRPSPKPKNPPSSAHASIHSSVYDQYKDHPKVIKMSTKDINKNYDDKYNNGEDDGDE